MNEADTRQWISDELDTLSKDVQAHKALWQSRYGDRYPILVAAVSSALDQAQIILSECAKELIEDIHRGSAPALGGSSTKTATGRRGARVLIVDDAVELRKGLRELLAFESDIEVVGEATNGLEAIDAYNRLSPDLVTMCVNISAMDGITATEEICKRHPEARIIIFSVQGDPDLIRRAMLAGAKDFIQKPAPPELMTSIRRWANVRG